MEVHLAASQVILQPEIANVEVTKFSQAGPPDDAYCGARICMECRASLDAEIFQQRHDSERLRGTLCQCVKFGFRT